MLRPAIRAARAIGNLHQWQASGEHHADRRGNTVFVTAHRRARRVSHARSVRLEPELGRRQFVRDDRRHGLGLHRGRPVPVDAHRRQGGRADSLGGRLAIPANGSFTFPSQLASGSDYSVVVANQPAGLTCTVTNGSGIANGNVRNIAVDCRPYSFTRRALPAIYSTGKAVNYSPYRTPAGPAAYEVPTDTEIVQDLTLLNTAGFNLLRLFGTKAVRPESAPRTRRGPAPTSWLRRSCASHCSTTLT